MQLEEIFAEVTTLWNQHIAFNRLLGFNIVEMREDYAEIHFDWDNKLMGNPVQKILHGGVTASVLDMVGGVVVAAPIFDDGVVRLERRRGDARVRRAPRQREGEGQVSVAHQEDRARQRRVQRKRGGGRRERLRTMMKMRVV